MTNRRERARAKARETLLCMIGWIVTIVQIVMSVLTIILIYNVNLLPVKYVAVVAVILIILILLCRLLMKKKKKRIAKVRFFIGLIIAALLSVALGAASYNLHKLTSTLQNITDAKEETTRVGVYVLANDSAETIQDAAGYRFGILEQLAQEDTANVVAQINEALSDTIVTASYDSTSELAEALLTGDSKAIIMNEEFVSLIAETEGYEGFDEQIREIASYEWKTVVEQNTQTEGEEAVIEDGIFTMFISGIDTAGDISTKSRSDVNIITVVNTNTRQVLLVSTPRDYFVPLSISGGTRDKLTHAGIYGVNVSKDTLGMLYGINIDYYFRINFSGFEELIDALGGVTVESDYTFDVAPSFHYEKGSNTLSGIEALAFARERHAFAEGDRQRGKNQMAVITGVINKMQSPAVLQNFSGLMKGLEGSFESDMPYDALSGLVKEQLSGGGSWNVVSYSVNGSGSKSSTYSMSKPAYVMIPDQSTVDQAKKLIEQVKNGDTIHLEQ